MPLLREIRSLTSAQRKTFSACFLGWTLDAFDFFLLTFCLKAIAAGFHVSVKQVAEAVFWTLVMRPVGAFLFGAMAERYGRRPTLMLNIVAFSVFELASAVAPTLSSFLFCRALFGIAMGGVWGVGAALALETLPAEGRGFFSGLLQEGYVVGNLLAAVLYLGFPYLHGHGFFTAWRMLFVVGAVPSLLLLLLLRKVDESPAWLREKSAAKTREVRRGTMVQEVWKNLPSLLALTVLMTAFMSFSHGTQDLYPTFLQKDHGFSAQLTGGIAILYNIGAIAGGIVFGSFSEKIGRKWAIILAALLALPVIPLYALSHSVWVLAGGAFVMQFMVQGAWGVVPAWLSELSPGPVRATFPGLAYQLGNFIASWNAVIQTRAAERFGLGVVLACTVAIVACYLATVAAFGRESRGADLTAT